METEKNYSGKLPSECTTIIIGRGQSADGAGYLCRSSDFDAMLAVNVERHQNTENGPEEFVAFDSKFRCPLPKKALGYTGLPEYNHPGEWGSAGYNTAGVGMSSTETIFSSEKALKADPYVEDGLAENCTYNIVLPYVHTAREGVERLGALIEQYGSAEGFGIGFIDANETWYLENAGGHRWLACRMPEDKYFVTGNQSRFREYNPKDKENFLAAKDLIEFAEKNGLYDPAHGAFDFHEAYSRDEKLDTTYNYPRVWGLQKMFSPSIQNDVARNTFPVYAEAEKKVSLQDLRKAFRFHYDNTDHDPYLHSNGKEPYRPVSIFRTTQTHILQVRSELPQAIGRVAYVAMGMADLSVFVPFYQGATDSYEAYTLRATGESDDRSAYWAFRKVAALGMTDYNFFAPIIKKAYAELEREFDETQKSIEKEYLATYRDAPENAVAALTEANIAMQKRACDFSKQLLNDLFTRLTAKVQEEYMFHGA